MIVKLNSSGFSYDVHSLVSAFYPGTKVTVTSPEDDTKEDINVYVSSGDVKGEGVFTGTIKVSVSPGVREESTYKDNDRVAVKNHLKRTLYRALKKSTGKDLPWGTLTGIRPTKIPMKMIREGKDDPDIRSFLHEEYLCSEGKTDLSIAVAHKEKTIIDSLSEGGFSLYAGIPFCPTTCMYCSFTSYPIASWKDHTGRYLDAVKKEIDFFAGYYEGRCADSIYIGGGTPTTLSPDELSDLIGYIRKSFDISSLKELTVEAGRPDSITKEKLDAIKKSGCDRISINPQTMNDKTLKIIGRRHTTDDVYAAFELARSCGFTNINMDLIFGLPGEGKEEVSHTLSKIKELSPDSVTIHSMAIKRAAKMVQFLCEHEELSGTNTPEMMDMAGEFAASIGLEPYYLYRQKNMSGNFENIGYARCGAEGIYNIAIMEEVSDIAATGAGTISKRVFGNGRIERCDNVKDVGLYIDRIDEMIDRKKKLFVKGE